MSLLFYNLMRSMGYLRKKTSKLSACLTKFLTMELQPTSTSNPLD